MLCLDRKADDWADVVVPGHLTADGKPIVIQVGVGQITRGRVKLLFDAPRMVDIRRHEAIVKRECEVVSA